MRVSIIATMVFICWGCKPENVSRVPAETTSTAIGLDSPQGSQAIPSNKDAMPPPSDPEEESKAMEPGIIGGAYLYCDAGEDPGKGQLQVQVACQTATVDNKVWEAAEKSIQFYDFANGTTLMRDLIIPMASDPYQMYFSEDMAQLKSREVQLSIALPQPQGRLEMTSTVSPYHTELALLRLNPGLTLMTSTDAVSVSYDRKTWSEWMPLKIPATILKLPASRGRVPRVPRGTDALATVELRFDDTVCTYLQGKGSKEEMRLNFVSCSRDVWKPGEWARVKAISLGVVFKVGATDAGDYAVTLQTAP
jgi:hypothetical protein